VDFDLRRCEIERAGCHPLGFQLLSEGIQQPDTLRELVVKFAAVESSAYTYQPEKPIWLTGHLYGVGPLRTRTQPWMQ
jgi:hypothetical protein